MLDECARSLSARRRRTVKPQRIAWLPQPVGGAPGGAGGGHASATRVSAGPSRPSARASDSS